MLFLHEVLMNISFHSFYDYHIRLNYLLDLIRYFANVVLIVSQRKLIC